MCLTIKFHGNCIFLRHATEKNITLFQCPISFIGENEESVKIYFNKKCSCFWENKKHLFFPFLIYQFLILAKKFIQLAAKYNFFESPGHEMDEKEIFRMTRTCTKEVVFMLKNLLKLASLWLFVRQLGDCHVSLWSYGFFWDFCWCCCCCCFWG